MQSQRVYLNGFDWVRAFMSVGIVTWHLHTIGRSVLLTEKFARFQINLADVFNFNVVLVAVPAFLLVSCYLLVRNASDWPRLRQRIWRLILLTAFWTVALSIWKGGYGELRKMAPASPSDLLITVLSANGEFYYFFVSLILCLAVTFLFNRLSTRWNWLGLVLSLVTVFFLPQVVISNRESMLIAYWNPLNFLPYPFAAILIHRHQDSLLANGRRLLFALAGLLTLGSLFAWYEWTHYIQEIFFAEGVAIPLYMRVSHVFLSAAIIILALWPWRTAPAVIRFMSKNSLALFILHGFFRPIVVQNTPALGFPDQVVRLLQLLVVIILSYVTALILPAFIKDELIR